MCKNEYKKLEGQIAVFLKENEAVASDRDECTVLRGKIAFRRGCVTNEIRLITFQYV